MKKSKKLSKKISNKLPKTRGFDVWLLIGKTNLKVHHALHRMLDDVDLSLAQHEILMAILRRPNCTQKEVATDLLVVKSNISAHISKLENRALIVRKADDSDGRNKRLLLTEKGEALVRESFKRQNALIKAMVSELSDSELEALDSIMRRVGGILDTLLAEK